MIPKQFKTQEKVEIRKALKVPLIVTFEKSHIFVEADNADIESRAYEKINTSKTAKNHEHVVEYNGLSNLLNALSGLTFGKLVRGCSEIPREEMKRLLTRE